jgi:leucyl-tRNA synthetase
VAGSGQDHAAQLDRSLRGPLEIRFALSDGWSGDLEVYTTRPDTLMGVTYMAVAPEHPLAVAAAAEATPRSPSFIEACKRQSPRPPFWKPWKRSGLPLGITRPPAQRRAVPVWVANFVLMGYGTGAVMSVPATTSATTNSPSARAARPQVIRPLDGAAVDIEREAYTEQGVLLNSGEYDGLDFKAGLRCDRHPPGEGKGRAERRTQYRLRDWGVSRQRYWGCPIPMLYDADGGRARCPERLPVVLPEDVAWERRGNSPLQACRPSRQATLPDGRPGSRETDTFDTFFESSWYYARFACADASTGMLDARAELLAAGRPSTSAASSTRCCTCCTRASSTRPCATPAW